MALLSGIVKAVLSGDTLVIMGVPKRAGPPPEQQLTLSSLQAPRVARGPGQVDEPFAFDSREFLRSRCIGRRVTFKIEYKVERINRVFGAVYLDGENLCRTVAEAGWANVKSEMHSRDGERSDIYDQLLQCQRAAEAAGRGIFNSNPGARTESVRDVKWDAEDPPALAAELKGSPQRALVEYVRDGASFRLLLLPSMQRISFALAGVLAPRLNAGPAAGGASPATAASGDAADAGSSGAAPSTAEPFARAAKHFTEVRLLNRVVIAHVEGVGKTHTFFGTLEHPRGNIAAELLRHGLARVADWSLAFLPDPLPQQLRAATRAARAARLRLWAGYTPPTISGTREFDGRVVEVVSGDTVLVLPDGGSDSGARRVQLASVRTPYGGSVATGASPEPFAAEAKEFMRKLLIGQKVSVSVDYVRKPREGATGAAARDRVCVTLRLKEGKHRGANAGVLLLDRGLGEAVRHRAEDECSADYEALLSAEARAKSGKRGVHGSSAPPARALTSLLGDAARAKSYLPFLRRDGDMQGVVDYVFTASRVKVTLPKNGCELALALAGIRAPAPARPARHGRPATAAEPHGEEAARFVRENILQRDVIVSVGDMDRYGTGIGTVRLARGGGGGDLATLLLQRGLAKVVAHSADRLPQREALYAAQAAAQRARAGVWEDYDEEAEEAAARAADRAAARRLDPERVSVRVSEVLSGDSFFVHVVGDSRREELAASMREFTDRVGAQPGAPGSSGPAGVRRGSLIAALFDEGEGRLSWYRARVESVAADSARVTYVDYGNSATVPLSHLRSLEPELARVPPQARACVMAFIKAPRVTRDYGTESARALLDLVWDRELQADVYDRDGDNRLVMTLYQEDGTSVQERLVADGFAQVRRDAESLGLKADVLPALQAAQAYAKRQHFGIFQYGDPADSEEEEREGI